MVNLMATKFIMAAIFISLVLATPIVVQVAQKLVSGLSSPSIRQVSLIDVMDWDAIIEPKDDMPGSGGGGIGVF